ISIINKVKLIVEETTDNLKFLFGETTIEATLEKTNFDILPKLETDTINFSGNEVKIVTKAGNESYYLQKLATEGGLTKVNIGEPSLEEIFVKLVRNKQ
ncbi:MAG: DUF4162 domain-containing protein, partial [Candidatus Sericytochromatia bacterium]